METKDQTCILCAVRELTEGQPPAWIPENDGDEVTGVVMKTGTRSAGVIATHGREVVPYVDLWMGGSSRCRVIGYSYVLETALYNSEATIGDRMTICYEGERPITQGKFKGRPYKMFTVSVERGHH